MDSKHIRNILRNTGRVTGKAALWTIASAAGLWILGEAGKVEAEKEAQRPPVIGDQDTYTAPFTTHGPWQLSWEGNLEIELWVQGEDAPAIKHGYASGYGGSVFFPEAGVFFLVIRLLQAGSWSTTIRCR